MKKITKLKEILAQVFKINDSPQKVALGFGLGVALGIFPGSGPLAALFLSLLLRVNRVSSLLGSLLTNTWLSFVTFVLAIKIGSGVMGISWQAAQRDLMLVLKNFHFKDLFNFSIFQIISPLLIGYLVVSFCLGFSAYLTALIIITQLRRQPPSSPHFALKNK